MVKKYFRLLLKRAFKIFPVILLVTVIVLGCLATAGGVLLQSTLTGEKQQKISIGVVGDLESSYLDIGLYALQNMDSSRFYVELVNLTEEEAKNALEERKIQGYILVPENYINNLYLGINTPAKYITLNGPKTLGAMFSEEIVTIVSELVVESQNGMYSMQDLSLVYDNEDYHDNTNSLMLSYMNFILNRTEMYEVNDLGIADSLSLGGYYVCGIVTLFLLLWGVSCNRLFSSRNLSYNRLLNSSGLSPASQILCEYSAYAAITTVMLLIFAGIFGIVISFVKLPVPELLSVGVFDCLWFVIRLIPATVMITLMQYTFYELIPNFIGALLAQFLSFLILGYLSGCLYPNFFFPDFLRNLMDCLPVGLAFSFIRKTMSNEPALADFVWILAYIGGFFTLSALWRKYRIAGDFQ